MLLGDLVMMQEMVNNNALSPLTNYFNNLYRGDELDKDNKTNESKQLEFSAESTNLKKLH